MSKNFKHLRMFFTTYENPDASTTMSDVLTIFSKAIYNMFGYAINLILLIKMPS